MKPFLTKLMLFLLPLVIVGGLAEGTLRSIPNSYTTKAEAMERKANTIEVLFFGSSHTLFGIDPSVMTVEGYNLANPSQSLDLDYRLYQRFAPQLPKLTTVVITVSSFSLFTSLASGVESWRMANYALYYDLDLPWTLQNQTELFSNSFKSSALKLWSFLVNGQDQSRVDAFGYQSKDPLISVDMVQSAIKASARHTFTDWSQLETQTQILSAFITEANQRGHRVILLIPPASSMYVERISTAQMEKTREVLSELAQSNPMVTLVDLLEDPRFELNDFYDADHLNQNGSRKLSALLDTLITATP